MKIIIRLCLLITCISTSLLSNAYDSWQQLETDQFRLIFQADIEQEAIRTANALETYFVLNLKDFPLENKSLNKVDIILYSKAHESNGNVGLAPSVSRWYNKPSNFSNGEWYDLLAVHEGRHVVQHNQARDNALGKLSHFLFGEFGSSAFINIFIPSWFLEGDAVIAETKHSNGGRGRTASFDLWWRADVIEHGHYRYDRYMLGTGFDRMPYMSKYVLGYFLTGYMYEQYGDLIFDDILKEIGSFNGFSFNKQIELYTGKNLREMNQDAFVALKEKWQAHIDTLQLTEVKALIEQPKKHWVSLYPFYTKGDITYALQVDVRKGEHIVKIENNKKTIISVVPKSVSQSYLSGAKYRNIVTDGSKFCWVDTFADPLKSYQHSGDIGCIDEKGAFNKVTQKDKLTSVIMVEDGFYAHRFTEQRKSFLVKLDQKGNELNSIELLNHSLIVDMSQTQNEIVFSLTNSDKNGIYKADKALTAVVELMTGSQSNIRSPILLDDWLVFTSDQSSIDQILAYSLKTKTTHELVTRPYGAYFINYNVEHNQLVFADYQTTGQKLVSVDLQFPRNDQTKLMNFGQAMQPMFTFEPLVKPLVESIEVDGANQKQFDIKNYNRFSNIINIHSFYMFTDIVNKIEGNIQSTDSFGKLDLSVGLGYYIQREQMYGSASSTYHFDSGFDFKNAYDKTFLGHTYKTAITLPMQFKSFDKNSVFIPSAGLVLSDHLSNKAIFEINYQTQSSGAMQSIRPKFGFRQSLYTDVTANGDARVKSTSATTQKGLFYNHGFDNSIELQWVGNGQLSLFSDSRVFVNQISDGYSLRTNSSYRVNLGPIGRSFTRSLYVRNTEVGVHLKNQYHNNQYEYAMGVSVNASINLFRNLYSVMRPEISIFKSSENEQYELVFGISIGN